ncbi:TRAP transporter large permease [bacterium]|nr:TRAP transporter large permease [bacterium]
MDPTMIGFIFVLVMMTSILIGIDVAVALMGTSFVGMWIIRDFDTACSLFGSTAFNTLFEYLLAAVPLFIIMGLFGNMSGASEDLFDSANKLLSRFRGGLGMATVLANAVFAAITGASIVSAAVFSKVAYPQMKRLGYEKKFSLGTIVGSSALGMLIPPSLLFIYYGYLTEVSIGRLFMAGIFPGLVLTAVFCIGIWIMVYLKPELAGENRHKQPPVKGEWLAAVFKSWAFVALISFVLGGIYLGVVTATEAGALGAFVALTIAIFRGRLTLKGLWQLLMEVAGTVGSIFILFIGAQMFSRMMALSTLPMAVTRFCAELSAPPFVVIIFLLFIYLLLGALIDSGSIILITTPIIFPIITSLGYDPIWYGVLAVLTIEIGLITPPFGLCVFVMKSSLGDEITVEEGFRGAFPFVIMMVMTVIIIFIFPGLSTWLPSRM